MSWRICLRRDLAFAFGTAEFVKTWRHCGTDPGIDAITDCFRTVLDLFQRLRLHHGELRLCYGPLSTTGSSFHRFRQPRAASSVPTFDQPSPCVANELKWVAVDIALY